MTNPTLERAARALALSQLRFGHAQAENEGNKRNYQIDRRIEQKEISMSKGPMINSIFERAVLAAREEIHDTFHAGLTLKPELIARAVLMAVLPTLERWKIQEEEGSMLGWCKYPAPDGEFVSYDDLKDILNDGEGE